MSNSNHDPKLNISAAQLAKMFDEPCEKAKATDAKGYPVGWTRRYVSETIKANSSPDGRIIDQVTGNDITGQPTANMHGCGVAGCCRASHIIFTTRSMNSRTLFTRAEADAIVAAGKRNALNPQYPRLDPNQCRGTKSSVIGVKQTKSTRTRKRTPCKIDGCTTDAYSQGVCKKHRNMTAAAASGGAAPPRGGYTALLKYSDGSSLHISDDESIIAWGAIMRYRIDRAAAAITAAAIERDAPRSPETQHDRI